MSLAKTIEQALWAALQRHAQSQHGTIAQVVPAVGPGQPVKVSGFFYVENVCKDVADALTRSGFICECPPETK
jgi:hypothetical protein